MNTPKPLTATEKERCLDTWGCVPVDIDFIRSSKALQSVVSEIPVETKNKNRREELIKMHGKWAKYYE